MTGASRVFVSYRHESAPQADSVLALADQLRRDGVDARIDRYTPAPPEGWPRWILDQLERADFVLCVCSPEYRACFEGKHVPGRGLGVNSEGYYILQEMYDGGNRTEKYVPVVIQTGGFIGDDRTRVIPSVLRPLTRYYLPRQYEDLYRRLTGQREVVAPLLGAVRRLEPLEVLDEQPPQPTASYGADDVAEPAWVLSDPDGDEGPRRGEGLYLARLVNAPSQDDPNALTAVWLVAHGERQYTIDSIEAATIPNELGPGPPPVTVEVDASYRIGYAIGKEDQPLIPAISLGPRTRRGALLTFAFHPDELDRPGVWLRVSLGYRTSDGRRGRLRLREPKPFLVDLTRQLGRTVSWWGELIAPDGSLCGTDARDEVELRWVDARVPSPGVLSGKDRRTLGEVRTELESALATREKLNAALSACASFVDLARSYLRQEEHWSYDLMAGVDDPRCAQTLREGALAGSSAAVQALSLRHVLRRDALLVDTLLEHGPSHFSWSTWGAEAAITALLLHPVPGWERVWQQARSESPHLAWVMLELRDRLPRDLWERALDVGDGAFGVPLFLRGSMNGWATTARLAREAAARYGTVVELGAGEHEFKIADAEWTYAWNLGGGGDGDRVVVGQPFTLVASHASRDLRIAIPAPGRWHFAVDVEGPGGVRLEVNRD